MRPLVFAPCEKVIVDRSHGVVSLIALLDSLTPAADGGPLVENSVAPQVWYVLTLWRCEQAEVGNKYQQKLAMENPSGKVVFEAESEVFEMKKVQHRSINTIRGFPVGVAGLYSLRLSLRAEGTGAFEEIATYPLVVNAPK